MCSFKLLMSCLLTVSVVVGLTMPQAVYAVATISVINLTARFADTVEATITGAGWMTEHDQAMEGPGASELNATFRRLLTEGGGAALLNAQLQRLLQQQRR